MDETPVSLRCGESFCRDSALQEQLVPAVFVSPPALYSVHNTTRAACVSSRARCNVPAEPAVPPAPPVRDFTAYFQGSPDCDPSYATSHTVPELDTRSTVIPTYSVGQSLRWHPYVETSSIEDISYGKKESKTCRCTKCSSKHCTAKVSSSSTLKSGSGRSSNIMTFADIYTMTPQLCDTACGSSIVSPPRQSQVSATDFGDVGRNSRGTQQRSTSKTKCSPTSILKYPRRRRVCDFSDVYTDDEYCEEDTQQSEKLHESGQDSYDNGPSRASSRFSFLGWLKKKEPTEAYDRETIYNEGISDQIRDPCGLSPAYEHEKQYSPTNKWRLRSCEYDPIPHAHRYNSSRYHRHCKHTQGKKVYVLDSEQCHMVPSTPRLPPHRARTPLPYSLHYGPCIKLPRKVLTSEVDIDQLVDPRCQLSRCARRNF